MSASNVDPHDKMRARDVNKVARGEQAPRPAHEYGTVSRAPPFPASAHPSNNNNNRESDHTKEDTEVELKTTPNDSRFPFMNQTRHRYARYIEYHKCIQEKGEDAPECKKFADYYKSLFERGMNREQMGRFLVQFRKDKLELGFCVTLFGSFV